MRTRALPVLAGETRSVRGVVRPRAFRSRRSIQLPEARALTPEGALALQRQAGNAATVQLLVAGAAERAREDPKVDLGGAKQEFGVAADAYKAGDYEEAYLHFKASYVAAPTSAQAPIAFSIGQCCRELDRYSEAQDWYEEYLAAGDTSRRADAEHNLREVKTKAAALRGDVPDEALAPKPDLHAAEGEFRAAETAFNAKDYETARDHFLAAYGEGDNKVQPYIAFNLGQTARFTRRFAEGVGYFEEYLASGMAHRRDHALMGLAECRSGLADAGSGDVSLPQAAPDAAAAEEEFKIGEAAYKNGDYETARGHFFAAYRQAGPKYQPDIAFSLGQACRFGGHPDEAIGYFKEYLFSGNGNRKNDALAGIRACRNALEPSAEA